MTETYFSAPIAEQIWDRKYRLKTADGTPIDFNVQASWERVAKALSVNEPERGNEFYDVLEGFRFLPAGRIQAGAGSNRSVTLFNCYVMGTIGDNMKSIFDNLTEAALTMQMGGGIGYDFSTLRPSGALVEGVAADASGPLSFMDCWDAMCRTIMSAGSRRGAMMGTMRIDHPNIREFIQVKRDSAKLRMFNLSVLVTDPFMEAYKNDGDWDLKFTNKHGETKVYDTVRARDLWDLIISTTYDVAEPGVIFIDRINKQNNLWYCETIAATNPCGEQPLPPYGACLLGSVNLAALVMNAFTDVAHIDMTGLEQTVTTAVRMLDNVVDVSNFPLPQQQAEAYAKRRIGLGVTGLADALIMMGITYGSDEAVEYTNDIMKAVAVFAYQASIDLAKEKGSFPALDREKFIESGFMKGMPSIIREQILRHGIRNSHLLSVAPTGTISMYANNVSSGIEPVFALSYDRKILNPDGSHRIEAVEDYAFARYKNEYPDKEQPYGFAGIEHLPEYFVTAQTLTPLDHLKMQAAAQRWVDSSISKTINVPVDISREDFGNVYQTAYDMGCKGCTTYRPNEITGSILSIKEEPKPEPIADVAVLPSVDTPLVAPLVKPRDKVLDARVYKISYGDHGTPATYITLSQAIDDNGKAYPFEIFINSTNVEHFIWVTALTRMISAVFRASHDSRFVVDELKRVFDPQGGRYFEGSYTPSIVAAIGKTIERFMQEIGYLEPIQTLNTPPHWGVDVEEITPTKSPKLCSNCLGDQFEIVGGCPVCTTCGESKCG